MFGYVWVWCGIRCAHYVHVPSACAHYLVLPANLTVSTLTGSASARCAWFDTHACLFYTAYMHNTGAASQIWRARKRGEVPGVHAPWRPSLVEESSLTTKGAVRLLAD
jgi:hypothetical protein